MRTVSLVTLVTVLCAPLAAIANNVNAGGQRGIVRAMSARTLGQGAIHVGAGGKYDFDRDYAAGPGGSGEPISASGTTVEDAIAHLLSGNLFFVYGVAPLLDIGLAFPLYYDAAPWGDDRFGPGDLELTGKLTWPFLEDSAFMTHAMFLRVTFPTGSGDRGYFPRHAYYIEEDKTDPGRNLFTANTIALNPQLAWSMHFDRLANPVPLAIHANLGAVVTTMRRGTAIVGALGIEGTPVEALTLFLEVAGEARVKYYAESFEPEHFDNDPVRLTPGLRLNLPHGFTITTAADISLSTRDSDFRTTWNRGDVRYATAPLPRIGVQLGAAWNGFVRTPDKDKDGIPDHDDACPTKAEDKDGYQDDDGCPDLDNDQDGIPDAKDSCPDKAARCDGCPVLDADSDGINDDDDACVNEPEDKDGFQDQDGCPDTDNDKDGIPDDKDTCPDEAEDKDGYQDQDGCPDTDNDGDGIGDADDTCPNTAGVADNDGCPAKKTEEIKRGDLILKGVTFQSGKAVLTPNSYSILDDVAESLREWPEVKLEIQGHTDSQGSAAYNLQLSQMRAEAVRTYFVRQGIDPSRLRAVGYGESQPIAENALAAGRARNRRVTLRRID
jgi:outer membrane protein OmpA-like peptidoglycan-associated protein